MQICFDILTKNAWVDDIPYIVVQCWPGYTDSPPGLRQRARSVRPSAPTDKMAEAPTRATKREGDEAQGVGNTLGMKKDYMSVSGMSER